MKSCFLTAFVLSLASYVTCRFRIDEFVQVCNVTDPELDTCVLNAANVIMPILAKGIKEFDIEPLDPLKMEKMTIGDERGSVSFQLILYDTVQVGLRGLHFDSAMIDLSKGLIALNGTIPYYNVRGRYKGKGRILMLPIAGEGRATVTFNNTKIFITMEMQSVKIENVYYLYIKNFRVAFEYDRVNMSLPSLLTDNKRLVEATQRVLNTYSKEALLAVQSDLDENYGQMFAEVLQKFFSNIPATDLFQDL